MCIRDRNKVKRLNAKRVRRSISNLAFRENDKLASNERAKPYHAKTWEISSKPCHDAPGLAQIDTDRDKRCCFGIVGAEGTEAGKGNLSDRPGRRLPPPSRVSHLDTSLPNLPRRQADFDRRKHRHTSVSYTHLTLPTIHHV